MFTSTIKSRVMKLINARIQDAETKYEEGCTVIEERADHDKDMLADECVRDVVSSIVNK